LEDFLLSITHTSRRILIFANGELPNLEAARGLLRADDFILCADGGTRHALALGIIPHVIIGDLDSMPQDFQPFPETQVIRFSADKNEIDLELAIQHALSMHPTQILIIAALGGRFDQALGNLSLITDSRLSTFDIRLHDGVEEIFLCRDQATVTGGSGDIVSLIPWGGEVTGVLTENLKWPLKDETLYPYKTRGISNEMLGEEASISIRSGLLLIVHRTKNL
jgi:thiamine pyrophosphokinase